MRSHRYFLGFLVSLALGGCATTRAPQSFEDALNSPAARQPLPAGSAEELRHRVGFVFANRARTEVPATWQVRDPDTLNSTTYDVLSIQVFAASFAAGNLTAGSLDLLTWFNAGLSTDARWGHYVRTTRPLVSLPNTQYYRFDARPGVATVEDVETAWEAAHGLMQALYPSADCHVFGWTPTLEYRRTHMKRVPGSHVEFLYVCRHPLVDGEQIRVTVSAWANPASGLRSVAMVESQCWVARPPSQWIDISACGLERANREVALIPTEAEAQWMQLVTTPSADDPGTMITLARYEGRELVLESPGLSPEYAAFLRAQRSKPAAEEASPATIAVNGGTAP
jgi:hypothetical protein